MRHHKRLIYLLIVHFRKQATEHISLFFCLPLSALMVTNLEATSVSPPLVTSHRNNFHSCECFSANSLQRKYSRDFFRLIVVREKFKVQSVCTVQAQELKIKIG